MRYWKGCITILGKIDYDNYPIKHLLGPDEVSTIKEPMKATKHSETLVKKAHCNLRKNKKWKTLSQLPIKHLLRPDEVLTIDEFMKAMKHSETLVKKAHYNLRKSRLWQLPNKTPKETRWGIVNEGTHEGNKTQWGFGEKCTLQS